MTPTYYKVGPAFWTSNPWNDDERLVALYILTCPHRTTEGLFRMPLEYAYADLGWPAKRFEKAFARLVEGGFIEYDRDCGVCLIVNALRWQAPANPNQVASALKALEGLPDSRLLNRFAALAATHCDRLAKGLAERFGERLAEPLAERLTQGLGEGFAHPPTPTPTPARDVVLGMGLSEGTEPSFDDDEVRI